MRPARRPAEASTTAVTTGPQFPHAPFVVHVLAQVDPVEQGIRQVANAYAVTDALGYELPKIVVATL